MKWINWKTVATTVAGVIVIGALGLGWNSVESSVSAELLEYRQMKAQYKAQEQLPEQIQKLQNTVELLVAKVDEMDRQGLTLTGRGYVQSSGSECCVSINIRSEAGRYVGREKLRITNLSHADNPSTVASISGTFRNSDPSYLAKISLAAADRLDARPGTSIDIRIEPAE